MATDRRVKRRAGGVLHVAASLGCGAHSVSGPAPISLTLILRGPCFYLHPLLSLFLSFFLSSFPSHAVFSSLYRCRCYLHPATNHNQPPHPHPHHHPHQTSTLLLFSALTLSFFYFPGWQKFYHSCYKYPKAPIRH